CTADPWIHNVDLFDPAAAFHPTVAGQLAYARAVEPRLTGLGPAPVAAAVEPRMTCVPGVASDPYRGRIRIPDLTSAEAAAAAERNAVPPEVQHRLVEAQRAGAANRRLVELDRRR